MAVAPETTGQVRKLRSSVQADWTEIPKQADAAGWFGSLAQDDESKNRVRGDQQAKQKGEGRHVVPSFWPRYYGPIFTSGL